MDISGVDELTANVVNANTYYNGPYIWRTTSYSASQTVSSTDVVILCDTSSGAITITLPTATTSGRMLYIKDTGNAGTNNIIISPDGSDTIDGDVNLTLITDYTSVTLLSDGSSSWYII